MASRTAEQREATRTQEPVRKRNLSVKQQEVAEKLTRRAQQKKIEVANDKARFLKALETHLGIITYAAEEVGIARKTVYNWIEADAEFADNVKDMERRQGHYVERKFLESIARGNVKAQTFYLATKGKWMGYGPEVMITTPEGRPFETRDTGPSDVDDLRADIGKKGMHKAMSAALRLCPEAFGHAPRGPGFDTSPIAGN